ncbi:MAG: aldehyde-activating protein [Solirubrobacterales bacterium]|nr:aldehyde-activating protein [Solirubrobacterales bacterium]
MSITGHCLCGNVTYSADVEPIMVAICHCDHCQRQSGAPFSLNVAIDRSALKLEGDSLKTYETKGGDADNTRERIFCSNCGSPLVSILAEADDMAFIKAGTLDDTSTLAPELEVYTDNAHPWFHAADGEERGLFPAGLPT